jgi:hypothetical protein
MKTTTKNRAAFQRIIKCIRTNNARFKKASPSRKIVMVSEDVVALVKARYFAPRRHYYVHVDEAVHSAEKEVRDWNQLLELPIPACEVCGIGAAMVASTLRLKVPVTRWGNGMVATDYDFDDTEAAGNPTLSGRALQVFPAVLLRTMEDAFEFGNYGYKQEDQTARLLAIYENLIQNKGRSFTVFNDSDEMLWSVDALKQQAVDHRHNGNCWHGISRKLSENDVCHDHDEPRGECSSCSPCRRCHVAPKGH